MKHLMASSHNLSSRQASVATQQEGHQSITPSVLIEEAFKQGCAEGENTTNLAKKCCLSVEEVQMWVAHLSKKKLTRAKGAQKARETRERKKKQQKTIT